MSDESRLQKLFRRGEWRTEVEVRRRELEHRLNAALARGADGGSAAHPAHAERVEVAAADVTATLTLAEHETRAAENVGVLKAHEQAVRRGLADAKLAIDSKPSVLAWITGSAVTMAWESVHEAAGELVAIESDDAVRSSLPRLVDWIQEVMPAKSELRKRYEEQLVPIIEGKKPVDRTLVRQAHQDALNANNEKHANLRTFRNLLLAATGFLIFLLVALAVWHAINKNFVSLCGATPPKNAEGPQRCFSGPNPARRDIAAIEVIGAIAGLLSVAFALGSEKVPPSRYNVRAAQIVLKPAAGAATALVGVLLVQSGIVVAPAQNASETLFLAYAAAFGFSQQLLTQFVDKRAGKLLGADAK